jgi:hypothetical protein
MLPEGITKGGNYNTNRMQRLRLAIGLSVALLLMECRDKKIEYSYYENGKVKQRIETMDGRRDGVLQKFYPSGHLKQETFWVRGVRQGEAREYRQDGTLSRADEYRSDTIVRIKFYFPSGSIREIRHYGTTGFVVDAEVFKENGELDSTVLFFNYLSETDTVKHGSTNVFKIRVLNVLYPIFRNGHLIVTSKFDTLRNGDVRLSDTVKMIVPDDGVSYDYEFVANKLGENAIYAQMIFVKEDETTITYRVESFSYPYFVE